MASIIDCFKRHEVQIDSSIHNYSSDEILKFVAEDLEALGYRVETGKSSDQKINVPVLFGLDNAVDKYFNADALSEDGTVVIEIEAGRAVNNNQFLKDIFQACMMFEVEYLVIAVRNHYRGKDDFSKVLTFLETLYISGRLTLPLKGILLLGY